MTTIAEALQYAADRFDAAVATITSLRDGLAAQIASMQTSVQTTINNFNARPLFQTVFVDPVNGKDTNDGSTIALAKKSVDGVLANIGSQGLSIILLGDDVIKSRWNVSTNIAIAGAQIANTALGYVNYQRNLSFLGTAYNSPSPAVGSYSAGIFFNAGQFFCSSLNIALPDVPAGLNTRAHIVSSAFVNAQVLSGTITASGSGAASLFGSFNGGRLVVTLTSVTLGTNAPGHVFDGIAAGANPNAQWSYSTNLTSA